MNQLWALFSFTMRQNESYDKTFRSNSTGRGSNNSRPKYCRHAHCWKIFVFFTWSRLQQCCTSSWDQYLYAIVWIYFDVHIKISIIYCKDFFSDTWFNSATRGKYIRTSIIITEPSEWPTTFYKSYSKSHIRHFRRLEKYLY